MQSLRDACRRRVSLVAFNGVVASAQRSRTLVYASKTLYRIYTQAFYSHSAAQQMESHVPVQELVAVRPSANHEGELRRGGHLLHQVWLGDARA